MAMKRRKMEIGRLMIYVILLLGSVIMLVPFLWMVLTSFKTYKEAVSVPIVWFPKVWQVKNYVEVLTVLNFQSII